MVFKRKTRESEQERLTILLSILDIGVIFIQQKRKKTVLRSFLLLLVVVKPK